MVGVSGTEGAAVALFLQKLKVSFTAHDFAASNKFERSFKANHFGYQANKREKMLKSVLGLKDLKLQTKYLEGVEKADLIFVSQNWEAYLPNRKLHKIFEKSPDKFATITQLYFQLFPGKIIAITGTNGKSTTAKLISEIMLSSLPAGRQVDSRVDNSKSKNYFTGNDRRNIQILDRLDKWTKNDWLTIEVSNRQLKFPLGRAPDIGVVLNVTKNHLDEYNGNFSAYKKGKFSLIANQKKDYIAVLNYDNIHTRKHIDASKGTPIPYSSEQALPIGVYVKDGWIVDICKLSSGQAVNQRICLLDKICLLGQHNLSNILAAVAATRAAGVKIAIIRKVIEKFRGIPQRLELIYQKNGVRFVNDSASTTPESTIAALESFEQGSVRLICGGETKGMDYAKLVKAIRSKKVRVVALKSPLGSILKKSLKNNLKIVETLQEAVKISSKNTEKGEIVLLSPAAAWFCYFAGKIPLGGRGFERFVRTLT